MIELLILKLIYKSSIFSANRNYIRFENSENNIIFDKKSMAKALIIEK
jgi:hypothetical protein